MVQYRRLSRRIPRDDLRLRLLPAAALDTQISIASAMEAPELPVMKKASFRQRARRLSVNMMAAVGISETEDDPEREEYVDKDAVAIAGLTAVTVSEPAPEVSPLS